MIATLIAISYYLEIGLFHHREHLITVLYGYNMIVLVILCRSTRVYKEYFCLFFQRVNSLCFDNILSFATPKVNLELAGKLTSLIFNFPVQLSKVILRYPKFYFDKEFILLKMFPLRFMDIGRTKSFYFIYIIVISFVIVAFSCAIKTVSFFFTTKVSFIDCRVLLEY